MMLEVRNLTKVYSPKGGVSVRALDDVSLILPETGMVFILGKSGSGKSTLLNVTGGLDKPDSGEIIVKGRSSKDFSAADFDSYRNTCIGFVFQEYNLLNEFSVEQNIALALELQGKKNDKAAVNALLEQVGLKGIGKRKPNTLSGGQKQRVAIARALIKEPEIIMADEPTGALDSQTGKQIFDALKKLSETKLVIVVSHDREFAERYADRIIVLKDGKIDEDVTKTTTEPLNLGNNVKLVSGDTITIDHAEYLTENDIKNILEVIKKNGGKAIITSGENKVTDVKKVCKINENDCEECFKTTDKVKTKDYDGNKTKFIKSKLPLPHAFKLGASGLKIKPVRLIFTVILSVIAFSLFGVLSAFMTYNSNFSYAKALQKTNNPAATVYTRIEYLNKYIHVDTANNIETHVSDYTTYGPLDISEEELKKLNDNSLGVKFAGAFNLSIYQDRFPTGLQNSDNDYFPTTNLRGFSDCGDAFLKSCGYTLSSGRYPINVTEIAVSEYVDEMFRNAGKGSALNNVISVDVATYNESGSIYEDGKVDLKITGIYRVGAIDEKFDELKNKPTNPTINEIQTRNTLVSSFKDYLNNSFHLIAFVTEDFRDTYYKKTDSKEKTNFGTSIWGVGFDYFPISDPVDEHWDTRAYTTRIVSHNKELFAFYDLDGNEIKNFDINNVTLGADEFFAPLPSEIGKAAYGYDIGTPDEKTRYFKNNASVSGKLTAKGFYSVKGYDKLPSDCLIVSDEFINAYSSDKIYEFIATSTKYRQNDNPKYSFTIAKTDNSLEQITYILKNDPENGITKEVGSEAYQGVVFLVSLIKALSGIFLTIGLILGTLAALLLLNFISASIAAKSKEIGILRAVGARGLDVFRIFFSEAFIFAMVCFVLSSLGSAWLCGMINAGITSTTIVPTVELLDYNILNIGVNLLVSLVVSAVATFLPVLHAARKPPVESIRML